uniref:Uncharacterized protein n=1 Tax=Mustela putorius furo TaxID=9669 RepID=M3Z3E3_MUSPF
MCSVPSGTKQETGPVLRDVGLGWMKMEQHTTSISRARDECAHISCKVTIEDINKGAIYWY